jgi:hypothetical protein
LLCSFSWRLPVFYSVTSECLTETRIRPQFGKAHCGTLSRKRNETLSAE